MMNVEKGMLAVSKAGHDRGRLFLIVESMEDSCLIVDGRTRLLERPKRKKQKHLQVICHLPKDIRKSIETAVTDEEIRQIISVYSLTQNTR